MAKIIATANHKGGVGKTTTAASLGAALSRQGQRVLVVDMDAQANLTRCLNVTAGEGNLYDALKGNAPAQPIRVYDNLDVLPGTRDLSAADIELANEVGREYLLQGILKPLAGKYDIILLDTPPSLGLLTINAFTAADGVIIPLQAEVLALHGLTDLLAIFNKVKQRLNKSLQIYAAVVTRYDSRKILNRQVLESVRGHFGNDTLTAVIRENVAIAEAPATATDIFVYAPKSAGAKDYADFAAELLKRL